MWTEKAPLMHQGGFRRLTVYREQGHSLRVLRVRLRCIWRIQRRQARFKPAGDIAENIQPVRLV